MIAYIDKRPHIEPCGGGFLVTFESGGEKVQLMLTRHAAFFAERQIREAKAKAAVADLGKEPIKFPKKKRPR